MSKSMKTCIKKSPSDSLRRALIYLFFTKKQNESCPHLGADRRMMMMPICEIHLYILWRKCMSFIS